MILIPEGEFLSGASLARVTLPSYYIDRLEVTNELYGKFCAETHKEIPVGFAEAPKNFPVVNITIDEARQFARWAGKRLPTRLEWEKAARGTDARRYPWGNSPADRKRAQYAARFNDTAPVDGFPDGASPYGVQDLAGNAWEWVSSAYRPYPYDAGDGRENPAAGPVRATRGGGHDSPAEEITTTQRGHNLSRNPAAGHHNIGFRCAK